LIDGPNPLISMSIDPQGNSCSDIGRVIVLNGPPARREVELAAAAKQSAKAAEVAAAAREASAAAAEARATEATAAGAYTRPLFHLNLSRFCH